MSNENRGLEPGVDEETNRPNERNDPSRSESSEASKNREGQGAAEREYPGEVIAPSGGEKQGASKPSGEDVDSGNE